MYYDRLLSKARTELNPKFEWAFYSYLRYDPITSALNNKPKGMHMTTYVHKLEYIDSLINKMHNCMQVIKLNKQRHADKINKQIDMIFSSR